MSSRNRPQKHQNSVAWTVNKHSYIAQKIAETKINGLCEKCFEIIEWRKRMGKYKPLTQPKKCVSCQQKRITEAYHVLCKSCGTEQGKCEKCGEEREIVVHDDELESKQEMIEHEKIMATMNERQRRTYRRKLIECKEDSEVD